MASDGGRAAFCGFLYQMLGVLGLKVWSKSNLGPTGESSELDLIFTVLQEEELSHEKRGQDAALRFFDIKGTGCFLFQFKYSSQRPVPSIGPAELDDIVRSFKASTKEAKALGEDIRAYFLVTNRRIGPEVKDILEEARAASSTKLRTKILGRLQTFAQLPKEIFEDRLKEFGQSFGLDVDEVDKGISQLIGDLVKVTAGGGPCVVMLRHIKEAFTGTPDARPLTACKVSQLARQSINDFPEGADEATDHLIRRSFMSDIQTLVNQRALVVVHGEGGCGKTAILTKWALDRVNNMPVLSGAFTCLARAKRARRTWIADTVREWGNLTDSVPAANSDPGCALTRLENANKGISHPVLHLGLDGIDEVEDIARKDVIDAILNWFCAEDRMSQKKGVQPRATLIVTCRQRDIVNEQLGIMKGFSIDNYALSEVEITNFTIGELGEVARERLEPDLAARIAPNLGLEDPEDITEGPPFRPGSHLSRSPDAETVKPEILNALRHPAIWRCFTASDEVQALVLDGDPAALQLLSKRFIEWCTTKTHYRFPHIRKRDIEEAFRQVAQDSLGQGAPHKTSLFLSSVRHTGLVGSPMEHSLYKEALLSGLIWEPKRAHWNWRHEFVQTYLAKGTESGMDPS